MSGIHVSVSTSMSFRFPYICCVPDVGALSPMAFAITLLQIFLSSDIQKIHEVNTFSL